MNYTKVADLHIHTDASDGAYPVAEVISMAADAGLELIAITDHDSVAAFAGLAINSRIEVIPGVELSADLNGREVHVLGYFLDPEDAEFLAILKTLRQKRLARAHTILRKLSTHSIHIPPRDVLDLAGGGAISRLHIAEILIDNGHSANLHQVFRDYLGPEGSAFVAKPHFEVDQAIAMIHRAGGTAVLAHPHNNFTFEEVASFAAAGLDGVEAYYVRHSARDVRRWLDAAAKLHLVPTGGSDFHGRRITDTPIGAMRVERKVVEELFERSGHNAVRRIS